MIVSVYQIFNQYQNFRYNLPEFFAPKQKTRIGSCYATISYNIYQCALIVQGTSLEVSSSDYTFNNDNLNSLFVGQYRLD